MNPTERPASGRNLLPWLLTPACIAAGVLTGLAIESLRADPLASKRADVQARSAQEKQQLQRQFERYSDLSPSEQQRIQQLHQAVEADPQSEQLLEVMSRYQQWLKTLSPTQRAELRQTDSIETQLASIETFQREQERRAPISREDVEAVSRWLSERVLTEEQRQRLKNFRASRERSRGTALWMAWSRFQGPQPIELKDDDFAALASSLSPEARKRLNNAKTIEEKRRLVRQWIEHSMVRWRSRMFSPTGGEREGPDQPMVNVSDEQLMAYFDKELSAEKREELLHLPPGEMKQRLRMYYLQDKHPDWPMRHFGPPRPEGKGPGGPRPGFGPRPGGRGPGRGNPDRGPGEEGRPDDRRPPPRGDDPD